MIESVANWILLLIGIEAVGVLLIVSQYIRIFSHRIINKNIIKIGSVLLFGGFGIKLIFYLVTWSI